jgi:uncharacterized membrane protein
LFVQWVEPIEEPAVRYPSVSVPPLSMTDLFDDAFSAIARDGAGIVEVGIRLQKAFASLAAAGDTSMADAARRQAQLALERAELGLTFEQDRRRIRDLANAPTGPS